MNQRLPSGPAAIVYGRLPACGSGNSVTSARAPGATKSARPANTSVKTIHGLSMRLPSVCAESNARRPDCLGRFGGPFASLLANPEPDGDDHEGWIEEGGSYWEPPTTE